MNKSQFYFIAISLVFLVLLQNIDALSQALNNEFKVISGKVIDENNEPLPFVNIYVESSTHGVTSNMEGDFSISIENNLACILVFQYVGFKKQTIAIQKGENPSLLKVILSVENVQLSEVVISANREDPAYSIIHQAIKKRKHYLDLVHSFSAKMYMKSNVILDEIPEKIFFVPKNEMPDSTDLGLVYLSESVSRYHFEKSDNQKEEMIASKVSGQKTGYSFNRADMILLN